MFVLLTFLRLLIHNFLHCLVLLASSNQLMCPSAWGSMLPVSSCTSLYVSMVYVHFCWWPHPTTMMCINNSGLILVMAVVISGLKTRWTRRPKTRGDGPVEPREMGLWRDPLHFGVCRPIGAPVELRRETEGEEEGGRRWYILQRCLEICRAWRIQISTHEVAFKRHSNLALWIMPSKASVVEVRTIECLRTVLRA